MRKNIQNKMSVVTIKWPLVYMQREREREREAERRKKRKREKSEFLKLRS